MFAGVFVIGGLSSLVTSLYLRHAGVGGDAIAAVAAWAAVVSHTHPLLRPLS